MISPQRIDQIAGLVQAHGLHESAVTDLRAMSGRQIERSFRVNPGLAEDYAGDVFWERRAIAARYLPQRRLLAMIDDADEVVRRVLAYRLPVEELGPLMSDPDREVRITVADRLVPEQRERLSEDPDFREVARRGLEKDEVFGRSR